MNVDTISVREKWQVIIERFRQYWHDLTNKEEVEKLEIIYEKLEKILEKKYSYQQLQNKYEHESDKFDIESFLKSNYWSK